MGDWSDVDGGASWGRSGESFGSSDFSSSSFSSSRSPSLFGPRSRHHSSSISSEGVEIVGGIIGLCFLWVLATNIPSDIIDKIVKGLMGLILLGTAYAVYSIMEPLSRKPIIKFEQFERVNPDVHMYTWMLLISGVGMLFLPRESFIWVVLPAVLGGFLGQRLSTLTLNLIVISFWICIATAFGMLLFLQIG